jgi:hypothetical protein
MIKIKLLEYDIHRNETTFRPFLAASEWFSQAGIEFIGDGDSYDYAFVGQASIIDKKVPLDESVEKGLEFLSKVTGDYIIVDGQDSHSLIGTAEILRESNAVLMLKNVMLNDPFLYKTPLANGRYYWGEGVYTIPDITDLLPRIRLSGCNWLSTVQTNWYAYDSDKEYDVSCMFGYPTKEPVYEHDLCQTDYYDPHRKTLFDTLDPTFNTIQLQDGVRIPIEQYYNNMYRSKIILAPLGYGAMAPRDLESCMMGSVLVKPNIDFLKTEPNIYKSGETYVGVNYDWSDLNEKVKEVTMDYKRLQPFYVENMRNLYSRLYTPQRFVTHVHGILSELSGMGHE